MAFLLGALLNSAWSEYFKIVFGLVQDGTKTPLKDSEIQSLTGRDAAIEAWKASTETLRIVELVLWIILAVVGVAGVIYSIYLGVKLARAEDQSKRDEAKKHLITVVIAIVVTLVLVVFFNTVLPLILAAVK